MKNSDLCKKAIDAMKYSYFPYSNYSVGAALLCKSGRVYTGCNIENSAFSPTVCAERTAFFKAISEGEKDFVKIAIAGKKQSDKLLDDSISPCGVCRQVMREFCNADFEILIAKSNGDCSVYKLSELLPVYFGSDNIK